MSALDRIVPTELQQRPQWVVWRYEQREDKQTKIPYMPSGASASSTDPATWVTFEQVVEASSRFDGVGYVFSPDDPYSGVDFDNCLEGDRFLHPEAAALVLALDS